MELKLNIYEKRKIVKQYKAETYDVMFGTIEDLMDVVDFEKFKSGKDEDLIQGVAMTIPKVLGLIKPLLKDIFDGLTDDEIKKCRISDIAKVLVEIVKFTIVQVSQGATGKN